MSELSERKGWEEGGGHIADNLNHEINLLTFDQCDKFMEITKSSKVLEIAWALRCESIANKAIKRMIENANNKNKK